MQYGNRSNPFSCWALPGPSGELTIPADTLAGLRVSSNIAVTGSQSIILYVIFLYSLSRKLSMNNDVSGVICTGRVMEFDLVGRIVG